MSKILIIGDTHIHNHQAMGGPVTDGINQRCMDIVRSILTVLARERPDAIVQLGDFFDVAKPPPAVVDLAMQMIKQTKVPWYILAGNHDIGTLGAPTAIRPLSHLPNVTIFEEPGQFRLLGFDCVALPYCSLSAEDALARVPRMASIPDLVFLHYGLETVGHAGPDYCNAKNLGRKHFHGHEHLGYSRNYDHDINVGSFCELRFGNECSPLSNCTARMGLRLTSHGADVEIAVRQGKYTGPVFITEGTEQLSLKELLKIIEQSKATSVYLRVGPDRVTFAQDLKSLGVIQDYAVLRQTREGSIEQYAADFERTDPLTAIAQTIVDRLEVGAMDESQAVRIMGLAKKELQI